MDPMTGPSSGEVKDTLYGLPLRGRPFFFLALNGKKISFKSYLNKLKMHLKQRAPREFSLRAFCLFEAMF